MGDVGGLQGIGEEAQARHGDAATVAAPRTDLGRMVVDEDGESVRPPDRVGRFLGRLGMTERPL